MLGSDRTCLSPLIGLKEFVLYSLMKTLTNVCYVTSSSLHNNCDIVFSMHQLGTSKNFDEYLLGRVILNI